MAVQSELGQIQEFLLVFKRRIWQIILPALFVVALGTVFAVIVPKRYVVSTQIELLQPTGHVTTPEASAALREISNVNLHLRNYSRVRETIVAQNWNEYAQLNDEARHEFVLKVRDNVSTRVYPRPNKDEPGSVFVDITYSDIHPQRAEKFLSALTQSWIEDVVQRDKNQLHAERDEYQNQVDLANGEFQKAVSAYTTLAVDMGVPIAPDGVNQSRNEEDPLHLELSAARQRLDQTEADLEEQRAKIEALQLQHAAMPPTIAVPERDQGIDYSKEKLELEKKIAAARKVQSGKKPTSIYYKKAQIEIEALEEQIQAVAALEREATTRMIDQPNPDRQDLKDRIDELESDAEGMEAELSHWVAEVADKQSRFEARTTNSAELIKLREAWDHAKKTLTEARARLMSANVKIDTYEASQGKPYRIAEAPLAPTAPTEPNPYLIVAIALLAGLAFGLAVAFLAEFSKSCFRSVGDLSRVMGVPILGVVNRIQTRAEARRERFRRAVIAGSSAMILASIGWFTYAIVYTPEKLPTQVKQAVDEFRLSLR